MRLKRKLSTYLCALLAATALTTVALTPATEKPADAFSVSVGQASGFTMHASFDVFATLHLGWTIHPQTVKVIDAALQKVKGQAQSVLDATAIAACKRYLGNFAPVCGALVNTFTNYIFLQFHNAAAFGVCVTIKAHVSLFTVLNPAHPFWDGFPYVDHGSWCNMKKYLISPGHPAPHYNPPLTPAKGSCTPYPQCTTI